MARPALVVVDLASGIEAALARLPAGAGVGQMLGPDQQSLVLATTASLRRWAAAQLGLGPKPAAGTRPKTNLAGIATAVAFAESHGPFHQRLCYERLLAPLVPLASRRDLKPPAFLQLDPAQRFPRLTVVGPEAHAAHAFGPFRDRRAAERARAAVHKLFPLRPCDYRFEPAPDLELGLACLFAQVRSCAAPCLARVSEDEYRSLAARATDWLGAPHARSDAPAVPPTVAAAGSTRALVVDAGRARVGLFPLIGGRVLDAAARWTNADALEATIAGLEWIAAPDDPTVASSSDWPWLSAWLRSAKARAGYLVRREGEDASALAARARDALAQKGAARVGDKVEAARGRD